VEEAALKQEVASVQDNVRTCLEELQSTTSVLHQGSKVLLGEYRKLLGL
jgi:hypothetical protein